ncbi:phytanoyl-CoA dioxygenase family protein [Sphingobium tyrosinilyticum]
MPLDQRLAEQLRQDGFCVIPDALPPETLRRAKEALDNAVTKMRAEGESTFDQKIDYTDANIRVQNLPDRDPIFGELLEWPEAIEIVHHLLGPDAIVASFTANIALPGSRSMKIHSDQALVEPGPWEEITALNIIWCLDDIYEENGATRYLPGSHNIRTFEELPADAEAQMTPFVAKAGSLVAMEGRVWHTSGANVTKDQERRLIFAYYLKPSVRPSVDWEELIKPDAAADH